MNKIKALLTGASIILAIICAGVGYASSPLYTAVLNSNGSITVNIASNQFTVTSQFSTPAPAWVQGTATNKYFTLTRTINTSSNEAIIVSDQFTNKNYAKDPVTSAYNLPIIMQHQAPISGFVSGWLGGVPRSGAAGLEETSNPTTIAVTSSYGVGFLPMDDVFWQQAYNGLSGTSPQAIQLWDDYYVLAPGATQTRQWAIVLATTPDYYAVINAMRRLLGTNFMVDGGFSFIEFTPSDSMAMTDSQMTTFISNRSIKYLSNNTIYPTITVVASDGEVMSQPHSALIPSLTTNTADERNQIARLHALSPSTKIVDYYDVYLEQMSQEYPYFVNDRLLASNGTQPYYGNYTSAREFLPTTINSWGGAMTNWLNYDLTPQSSSGMGLDGIYQDEFEQSEYWWHYGGDPTWSGSIPWDGCSADISGSTFWITRRKSAIPLATQAYRIAEANRILNAGCPLWANSEPTTMSMMAVHFPHFVETATTSNYSMAHLFTPIGLSDPTSETTELVSYHNMLTGLSYGCLYAWYGDAYNGNTRNTHQFITKYMYPFTPVELHQGYIIGTDRILTSISGTYGWGDDSTFTVHAFNTAGVETSSGYTATTISSGGHNYLQLTIGANWSAAIMKSGGGYNVKGVVTLQSYTAPWTAVPVTVQLRMSGGSTTTQTINLASDGSYTIGSVMPGTYNIAFKASHWLQRVVSNVVVSTGDVTGVNALLLNGDVNGDNFVEDQDYSLLGAAWYSAVGDSNYNVNADLNGDGYVEDQDYSIMGANWYAEGDQ
jgi:hypothetical protein